MRRLLVVPLLSLGLVAGSAQVALGEQHTPKLPERAAARATQALEAAAAAKQGKGHEVTMALVDLRRSYKSLTTAQKKSADAVFARPTDAYDPSDPFDDPSYHYTVAEAAPFCTTNVCVHYVQSTDDAPANTDANVNGTWDWAETTAAQMQAVWDQQVGTMGFRAPASDAGLGGSNKFDVYVQNLGDDGLYGYCAPEADVPGTEFRASGYCVLDDDYAEFPIPGLPSLQVTAAHEFFHAVQFNYDYAEDPWIMEASATWMEERYADDVNDSRGYLQYGQLGKPTVALDSFQLNGLAQYGNWLFFEFLSQRYGVAMMKRLWTFMDSAGTDQYSTQAINSLMREKRTTFANVYSLFAASNLMPKTSYGEGAAYPAAPIYKGYAVSATRKTVGWQSYRVNHMANLNFRFVPQASLTGTWRLRITVDGPLATTAPAAYAILHLKDGRKFPYKVALNSNGDGSIVTGFSPSTASHVSLTLVNASTKFNCWDADEADTTWYSCFGTPRENGRVFRFTATAIR